MDSAGKHDRGLLYPFIVFFLHLVESSEVVQQVHHNSMVKIVLLQ